MTTEPTPEVAPNRSAMFIAFLVTAIDLLGFGIVLPLVPRIADDYLDGFSPAATGLIIGLLYSSFSLMQFIFAPIWGRISDRIGRRPILLLSLVRIRDLLCFVRLCLNVSTKEQATLALVSVACFKNRSGDCGGECQHGGGGDCRLYDHRRSGPREWR